MALRPVWLYLVVCDFTMSEGLYLYPGANTSSTMLRLQVISSRNRITFAPSLSGVRVVAHHRDPSSIG